MKTYSLPRPRHLFPLAALAAFALLAACGEDEGPASNSTCPPASTLTYANFGQAFMATNCNRCHSGDESPNLTSQGAIQSNRNAIDKQAAAGPNATNTYMPPNGSVSLEDRQKLGEWLACGAP